MSSFLQNARHMAALGKDSGSSMCQAPSTWREAKVPSPTELTFGWAGRQIVNTQTF